MYANVNNNEYRIHIGMLIAKDAKCVPFKFGTNDKIKPSVNIYKGAKIAFIMGYNYCNGLGSDNENIRKLYL